MTPGRNSPKIETVPGPTGARPGHAGNGARLSNARAHMLKSERKDSAVRKWRTSRGLSLADWARRLGCAIGTLSDVETGKCGAGLSLRLAFVRETRLDPDVVREECERVRINARRRVARKVVRKSKRSRRPAA